MASAGKQEIDGHKFRRREFATVAALGRAQKQE